MLAIDTAFGQHFDRAGKPLNAGYIYIGTVGLNPITNPIAVYWDAAGTQPAAQPIRTLNGYPVRSGTPALIYVSSTYSMLVQDKAQAQVFYLEDSSSLPSSLPLTLASKTSVAGGSGALGHNQTLSYASGTVGAFLNDQMVDVKAHPFLATGDGVTDDRAAVVAALTHAAANGKYLYFPPGNYYFSDHIKPANGTKLLLRGAHRDLVTIRAAAGKIPFYCDNTVGIDNRLAGADIEGVTFDGGHTRTPAFYPYNADTGTSIVQALNLRGVKGSGDDGHVRISRCRFQNINGLPLWVSDFDGSVEVSFNEFIRTKDMGILYNNNVTIVGNVVKFSADNGMSISRSNQNIYIAYNHITDCAFAGIFVGGVNYTGSGASLTLTGATYAVGDTLTMTASTAKFGTEDQGINYTLRSGTDRAIVRMVSVESATSATVVALRSVPASLQATATANWAVGPISGAQAGCIVHNVIEGASSYGIWLSAGCKDLVVHGNAIRRTGITADSEVYTTGSMLLGSTTLNLVDGSGFATNDWFVILPDYTSEDYFIAKANLVAGNVITSSAAPPQTITKERVHRAYRRTAAYGILALGQYENASILEFAENLTMSENVIVDTVTGGIRVGSTSGAIRRSQIVNNKISLRQNAHIDVAVFGVSAGDVGNTDMRTVDLKIYDNDIRLSSASGSRGVAYYPIDNNANSYIEIGPNWIKECVTEVEVIERTGSTDITRDYKPVVYASSLPIVSLVSTKTLGLEIVNPTFNAGVLTVLGSYGTPDISAGSIVVTDIALDATVMHTTPRVIVRNSHAANTITFNHNTAKIRTITGANYVLNPNRAAEFVAISPTVWQQLS